MVARAWLRAWGALAALTVGVLCALLVGCTPSPETVRPVAEALLLEALGEPYTVLAVKSEFNEGNGDPGRVRIWARSGADAELLLVFSTSFRGGHLEITADRLRAIEREERASLDGSRAFIRAATPSFERFAVRARTTSSGELRVDLRLFEDVCEVGEGCTLYERLAQTTSAFAAEEAVPFELTAHSFDRAASDRPSGGVVMATQAPPGEALPWRSTGSLYVLSTSVPVGGATPAELRAAIGLNRSAVAYHTHWTRMRAALTEERGADVGEPMHLDAGGKPLALVAGSLTKARFEGVTCPEASLGRRTRCPDEVRRAVACVYDLESGAVEVVPPLAAAP